LFAVKKTSSSIFFLEKIFSKNKIIFLQSQSIFLSRVLFNTFLWKKVVTFNLFNKTKFLTDQTGHYTVVIGMKELFSNS